MNRKLSIALLVIACSFVGCKGTTGPFARKDRGSANANVTDPLIRIDEQEARGRAAYSYPEADRLVPQGGMETYGPTYSQYGR